MSDSEKANGFQTAVEYPGEDSIAISNTSSNGKEQKQSFDFERVFGGDSTQEQVFNSVKDLITSVVDGYNVCIFAYGQTGSGKTYTMEGPTEEPGVNIRALQELFSIRDERSKEYHYTITVSMLEIYNEQLRDMLSDSAAALEIKQSNTGIQISFNYRLS